MNDIFKQAADNNKKQQDAKRVKYYKLLSEIDVNDPTESQSKALGKLMQELRINSDMANGDHKLVKQIAEAKEVNKSIPKLRGEEDKLYNALSKAYADRQKTWKKVNQDVTNAYMEHDSASRTTRASNEKVIEARKLIKEDPLLGEALGNID